MLPMNVFYIKKQKNGIESGGVCVGEAEFSNSFLKCHLKQEGLAGKDSGIFKQQQEVNVLYLWFLEYFT